MTRLFSALLFFAALSSAQDYYRIAIDQDRLSGAADFSFLNHPLGPADRLFLRDGHFHRVGPDLKPNTADDERVRLFGVNLAFGANFPDQADAPRIARRLRRLGVNLVRLHHMDSQPDSSPSNAGSILTTGPYPTLNTVAVARLRAFLSALEAEGIYADLNLHVGYQFRPAVDNVPGTVPSQSKPLHIFFPRMVELQTEFARAVFTALELKGDPVLGMVEIDNESSLVHGYQSSWDPMEPALQGAYRTELQRQWNVYLAGKYANTSALAAAWGGAGADGPDMLPQAWQTENHATAFATNAAAVAGEPVPTVQVQIQRVGDVIIVKQVGFSLAVEKTYAAELEIRADLPAGVTKSLYWDIKQNDSPWQTETSRNIDVTSQWQKYRMVFQPTFAIGGNGRFGVSIENLGAPMTVYLRSCSLRETSGRGLTSGESLEAATVSLPPQDEMGTETRTNDYLLFLTDRDREYLRAMIQAVRQAGDALVPVAGTQMGFGGLLNLDSHTEVDYQDNHFYIDHYNFPNVAWDGRDWTINDESATGGGLTAFEDMAAARPAGMAYTVSEYNQPWPNTHAAEIGPLMGAFGAFQDWDGIMHFAYSHGRSWDDGVPNGFNLNGDWTKFPNTGQTAWMFRSGSIRPSQSVLDLPVNLALRLRSGREKRDGGIASFLQAAAAYSPEVAFAHGIRLVKDGAGPLPAQAAAPPAFPVLADTGETTYDRDRGLFLIHAPSAAGAIGALGKNEVRAGSIDVQLGSSARGFAAILATSLDGKPIRNSAHLLLSTPGYALRTQPGSQPERPQQLVHYGTSTRWTIEREPAYPQKPSGDMNGGQKPVWMERVESFVTLHTSSRRIAVYPLDGAGGRMDALQTGDIETVPDGFRIHIQADGQSFAPWYEIVADAAPARGRGSAIASPRGR